MKKCAKGTRKCPNTGLCVTVKPVRNPPYKCPRGQSQCDDRECYPTLKKTIKVGVVDRKVVDPKVVDRKVVDPMAKQAKAYQMLSRYIKMFRAKKEKVVLLKEQADVAEQQAKEGLRDLQLVVAGIAKKPDSAVTKRKQLEAARRTARHTADVAERKRLEEVEEAKRLQKAAAALERYEMVMKERVRISDDKELAEYLKYFETISNNGSEDELNHRLYNVIYEQKKLVDFRQRKLPKNVILCCFYHGSLELPFKVQTNVVRHLATDFGSVNCMETEFGETIRKMFEDKATTPKQAEALLVKKINRNEQRNFLKKQIIFPKIETNTGPTFHRFQEPKWQNYFHSKYHQIPKKFLKGEIMFDKRLSDPEERHSIFIKGAGVTIELKPQTINLSNLLYFAAKHGAENVALYDFSCSASGWEYPEDYKRFGGGLD